VTDADRVLLAVDEGLARLTLNRPDQLNTIDLPTATALLDAALACAHDSAVRAVLVEGAGKSFCAGGDLRSFAATGKALPGHLRDITAHLHAALTLLAGLDVPVVVAVQGAAAGAGLGIAALGDVVVAGESARFVFAYTALGLSPDAGTSWALPRLVGPRLAMDMALTNRALTAAEALTAGLVTRVVDDSAVTDTALALARELATGPTSSYAATKRLLRRGFTSTLAEQLEEESRLLSALASTGDAAEGLSAFIDKRAPRFTGE
jgi:2-(1,2-epoxy-1,2-dihydrophenyl)acetyl-CoA isomerase